LQRDRIDGFDVLRVICVGAVVGIHCFYTDRDLSWVPKNLSFAVPCFVLMAMYLSERQLCGKRSRREALGHRLSRLLPAFLAWTFIYVLARWSIGSVQPSFSDWVEYVLLGASALHLYFIPMILCYSLVQVMLSRSPGYRAAGALAGLLMAVLLQYQRLPNFPFDSPEAKAFPFYFVHNLPYLFAAILLFRLCEPSFRRRYLWSGTARWTWATVCGSVSCLLWFGPIFSGSQGLFHGLALNTFLFLTFLFWPMRTPRWLLTLASVSYGVFLSHHLVIEGLLHLERFAHLPSQSGWVTVSRFACGLFLSAGFCLLLSKDRRTAWLVQ
jgi:peptidoglycan/LPS O-acetylase OafA/YrhL